MWIKKCRVVKQMASNRLIISHKMFFITLYGSHRNKQPICFQVPQSMSLLGISTWWCVASLFNSMRHFSTRAYVLLFYEIFVPETGMRRFAKGWPIWNTHPPNNAAKCCEIFRDGWANQTNASRLISTQSGLEFQQPSEIGTDLDCGICESPNAWGALLDTLSQDTSKQIGNTITSR